LGFPEFPKSSARRRVVLCLSSEQIQAGQIILPYWCIDRMTPVYELKSLNVCSGYWTWTAVDQKIKSMEYLKNEVGMIIE
jgi:hypothetical protein